MSQEAIIFYIIAAVFVGAIIIGIARENNRYSKPLPTKPERLQNVPELQGNFDANALQTAKAMETELTKYPDSTSRTLALAEMLHRQKAYELRQTDRNMAQERKDADALDRVMGLVDRIMPRNTPPYPFRPYNPYNPDQRINGRDYHDRHLAEQQYWDGGYWK
jgi:hypothetical protein